MNLAEVVGVGAVAGVVVAASVGVSAEAVVGVVYGL